MIWKMSSRSLKIKRSRMSEVGSPERYWEKAAEKNTSALDIPQSELKNPPIYGDEEQNQRPDKNDQ